MANELFCMGCMQPISEFSDNCYHCGYPVKGQNPEGYLPVRTRLGERYVVGRALEKRGDAIVYIGYDKTAKNTVIVREFYPEGIAQRLSLQVVPLEGRETAYDECLEQFRKQSRIIARMRDVPAMISTYDMFEDNGTMYTIADHVEGVPFRRYLETLGGHMKWEAARPMFVPLLTSLITVHAAGLYHLGISPDSILVDSENRLRLDGWQLADVRTQGGDLMTLLPKGYAAPEQYVEGETVSQEADVYAVGATMLYALTGEEPPAAPDRVSKVASLMVPANVAQKWPSHIAPTLCDALLLSAPRRIKTVEMLRERLTVAPVVEALREDALDDVETDDDLDAYEPKNSIGYKVAVALLSCLCALLVFALAWLLVMGNPLDGVFGETEETTTTTVAETTTTTGTKSTALQYAVEDLVGRNLRELEKQETPLRGNMTVNVVGKQYSDTIPAGVITEQDPMPETYADINSVINVYVSAGPREREMVNLIGWERGAAITYLEGLGYKVTVREVTTSPYERGRVDGMAPAPGEEIYEGDEVVLQISMVPETTAPPTTTTTTRPGVSF